MPWRHGCGQPATALTLPMRGPPGSPLLAAGPDLRIGVPFAFSMHRELIHYWLEALGLPLPPGLEISTVPPPRMAEALAAGEIDAFCVGEPRGSVAVDTGGGRSFCCRDRQSGRLPRKRCWPRGRAGPRPSPIWRAADPGDLAGGALAGPARQSQRRRRSAGGTRTAGRGCRGDRTGADRAAGHLADRAPSGSCRGSSSSMPGPPISLAQSGGLDRGAAGPASWAGPAAGHCRCPGGVSQRSLPAASAGHRGRAARRLGQGGGVAGGADRGCSAARAG